LLVVAFAIPPVITVSFQKRLFDNPSESRKIHKRIIPNFGGIAIFTGFLFTCSLFIPTSLLPEANILMGAGLILFMTGLKDDIVGLSPLVKFIAQFTSAFIIAMVANLRIVDLHGIMGVNVMPYYASITLTVFFIVGIVNAFNLIDGIDGLAGSLGVIFSLLYAYMFYRAGAMGWSYLSLSLTGALIGFLFFNVTPARIFMGDSGSLMLGFVAAVLSIKFMGLGANSDIMIGSIHITAVAGLVVAILIIPIFDTLRVFTLRILRNTSPFTADSNHLHHRLLFLGLSHVQATLVLSVTNVLFIVMALSLQHLDNTQLVSLLVLTILCINGGLSVYIEYYKKSLSAVSTPKPFPEKIDFTEAKSQHKKSFGEEILEKISEN
jgi:UDP-N-acetylmuramyl pentapeptide phosphotransferase/UDP-N-acetylglucosamine-1-phosphate transferase